MTSSLLPDELWMRVLEIGGLTYKDLCCLSITSRRFHRLTSDDTLWFHLLASDFPPNPSTNSASKREPDRRTRKVREAVMQVAEIDRAREASAGLNVWQPEIVMGRMRQIVGAESRLRGLEMEMRICRQQISVFEKACREEEKRRLCLAQQELQAMMYHPLLSPPADQPRDARQCRKCPTRKSKKMKRFRDSSVIIDDDDQGIRDNSLSDFSSFII